MNYDNIQIALFEGLSAEDKRLFFDFAKHRFFEAHQAIVRWVMRCMSLCRAWCG